MGVDFKSIIGIRLLPVETEESQSKKQKTEDASSDEETVYEGEFSKKSYAWTTFRGDTIIIFSEVYDGAYPLDALPVKNLQDFLKDFEEVLSSGEGELVNFIVVC